MEKKASWGYRARLRVATSKAAGSSIFRRNAHSPDWTTWDCRLRWASWLRQSPALQSEERKMLHVLRDANTNNRRAGFYSSRLPFCSALSARSFCHPDCSPVWQRCYQQRFKNFKKHFPGGQAHLIGISSSENAKDELRRIDVLLLTSALSFVCLLQTDFDEISLEVGGKFSGQFPHCSL